MQKGNGSSKKLQKTPMQRKVAKLIKMGLPATDNAPTKTFYPQLTEDHPQVITTYGIYDYRSLSWNL